MGVRSPRVDLHRSLSTDGLHQRFVGRCFCGVHLIMKFSDECIKISYRSTATTPVDRQFRGREDQPESWCSLARKKPTHFQPIKWIPLRISRDFWVWVGSRKVL